ncbi:MAG: hypothetical protein Rhims3KO_00070 [Hyphomicrobiales bacterium]
MQAHARRRNRVTDEFYASIFEGGSHALKRTSARRRGAYRIFKSFYGGPANARHLGQFLAGPAK